MKNFLSLLLIVSSIYSNAQLGGTTVFNTMNIPGSARIAAMGGSYFAIKDGDIQIAAFNPSVLDSTMHNKVAMSYVDYFDHINMGYAAYARRMSQKITAAATMQYINYGAQTELDALGYELGNFNSADYTLTLGAGLQYDSLWSMGASLKTIYSSLANYTSLGFALDAGITYHKPARNFTASLIAKNFGMQVIAYSPGESRKLPFEFQIGISKRPAHAPFRFSIVYENMQRWDLTYTNPNATIVIDPVTGEVIEKDKWEFGDRLMRHIVAGTEILLGESFSLRVGYNYRKRQELKVEDKPGTAGFSYGFGFKVKRLHFSYGRAVFHLAGPANHFSVTTSLSQW
ncbi:MAG: type IX secretion system protein PorQ [Flavobacteriales bacterium]